jgi:hypothetical protein
MMNIIPKTSRSMTSIVLLVAFLGSLLNLPVCPVKTAESSGPMVWVLTETLVNPNDEQMEFYGGGATPGWFTEARFEGKFTNYGVTETSFRINDRDVDREYEFHNVTVETFFEKPPLQLTPGETVKLIAGFSHSGTAEDAGVSVGFLYDSDDVDIQADFTFDNTFVYAPWEEDFNGVTEETYTFVVPPAATGGEIEIYASGWNAPPCLVIWKYQAQELKPEGDTAVPDIDQDRELGEDECARMQQEVADQVGITNRPNESDLKLGIIGVVVAQLGDVIHDYCTGGKGAAERGSYIKIGDCIRTGSKGLLRIRLSDRDDSRDAGPTYINMGRNSEMCFEHFSVSLDHPTRNSTLVNLIKGTMKVMLKGWDTNASFSVKAGVAICGIRGSEVYILHSPEIDFVSVMVLEGHADVTSETTGETVSLSDYQEAIISKGDIVASGDFEQEQWDAAMEESSLGDEDFPDADVEWPSDLEETAIEEPTFDAEAPVFKKQDEPASELLESLPVTESVAVLCGVLLCGATIIAVVAVVFFLVRRRSKRKPEDDDA